MPHGNGVVGSPTGYLNEKDFSLWDRWFNSDYVDTSIAQAAAQVDYQRSQASAREAMEFEAEQAELAYQRSQASAREAMEFEAAQTKFQRDWIDSQRANAYQTQVQDLRRAGLNPILAAFNGGAPVVGGSAASGFSANSEASNGYFATSHTTSNANASRKADRVSKLISTLITCATQLITSQMPKVTINQKG